MGEKVQKPHGPEPDHLQIEGPWEKAAGKALRKPRPWGGWPKNNPEPTNEKPASEPTDDSSK